GPSPPDSIALTTSPGRAAVTVNAIMVTRNNTGRAAATRLKRNRANAAALPSLGTLGLRPLPVAQGARGPDRTELRLEAQLPVDDLPEEIRGEPAEGLALRHAPALMHDGDEERAIDHVPIKGK